MNLKNVSKMQLNVSKELSIDRKLRLHTLYGTVCVQRMSTRREGFEIVDENGHGGWGVLG